MSVMSTSTGGVARRIVGSPLRPRQIRHIVPVTSRLARTLWLHDRGVAEMRWASITLLTIALLSIGATWLDPSSGDFDRMILLTVPATIAVGALAWSRLALPLGRSSIVRSSLGPGVLLIAMAGCGVTDLTTLQAPPGAPMVLIAMAYAAMTPGFVAAAAMLTGSSIAVLIAHAQITQVGGELGPMTDEFTVGFIAILLASTGMAFVVRVATDAESRATRLSASNRQRVDVLQRVNRIVARFDGSQPVENVIQAVVDDISREFQITLVSMYLPTGSTQLSMVGVAGYPDPFHVIDVGVGIIGRAAETQQTQFVPDVLVRSRLSSGTR